MVKERIAVNCRIAIVAITNTKVSANTFEVVDILVEVVALMEFTVVDSQDCSWAAIH